MSDNIGERAKEMTLSLFADKLMRSSNKELKKMYEVEVKSCVDLIREIREHRESVSELNRRKSVVKKGIVLLEKLMKQRKLL